jgi:hypothetical protein
MDCWAFALVEAAVENQEADHRLSAARPSAYDVPRVLGREPAIPDLGLNIARILERIGSF